MCMAKICDLLKRTWFLAEIFAKKEGDHILITFKCNLFSVSDCVVCASGHPSSILDHEFPMIIKGEYKVHLLNDKKRRNACLSCLPLICEKPFLLFSLYLFSTISPGCSEFGTISSSHDRDIRSPTFSKFCIYSSQSRDSRTFIFNTWCFNELEFICKTHICKQINVLLGPTSFISKSCSKEEKMDISGIVTKEVVHGGAEQLVQNMMGILLNSSHIFN